MTAELECEARKGVEETTKVQIDFARDSRQQEVNVVSIERLTRF